MKYFVVFASFLFWSFSGNAQEDDGSSLLDLLEEEETTTYASASFKTTRIINAQSIENVGHGVLDFKISHRFGMLNSGAYEAFGLDNATIRLGLDYGITENLMVGFGRSSWQKALDGFVKYRILRQSAGKRNMPITLSVHSSIAVNMLRWANPERDNFSSSRLVYTHQILMGRKISSGTSIMLMPTMIHRNLVETAAEKHDVYAVGIGGRQKLTNRLALTGEYYYVLPDQIADLYSNALSLGIDIETGGHVFQLHFTNSTAMIDKGVITETTGQWGKGDIHFGFNVSRVFTIREPKRPKE